MGGRLIRFAVALGVMTPLLMAQPALACRVSSDRYTLLWPEMPQDAPEGHEVLHVRVLDMPQYQEHRFGQLEVLGGPRQGDILLVRPFIRSNCEITPPSNAMGYVSAKFDADGFIDQLAGYRPMREILIPLATASGAADD